MARKQNNFLSVSIWHASDDSGHLFFLVPGLFHFQITRSQQLRFAETSNDIDVSIFDPTGDPDANNNPLVLTKYHI